MTQPGPAFDIARHRAWFEAFAEPFRQGGPEDVRRIDLKIKHSLLVLDKASRLCERLDLDAHLSACARLAALYHDLGRFPQYQRYRTFRDPDSVNHALLGVRTVRAHGPLKDIDAKSRSLICAAIMVHNRKSIPAHMRAKAGAPLAILAGIVRDADKLDIIRVMLEHFSGESEDAVVTLGLEPSPDRYLESVADCLIAGTIPSYRNLRYVNDMRLMLASWIFDLNFPASREAFFAMGALDRLLDALPQTARIEDIKTRILRERPDASGQAAA